MIKKYTYGFLILTLTFTLPAICGDYSPDIREIQPDSVQAVRQGLFMLRCRAVGGQTTAILALESLKKKAANPNYKINYPRSRKLLIKLKLLNRAGNIPISKRSTLKEQLFIKSTKQPDY